MPASSLASDVVALEERLIAPTQVEVDAGGEEVLVPGKIIGVDVEDGGPRVDAIDASAGRQIDEGDVAPGRVMVEPGFVEQRGLAPKGTLRADGIEVGYVGYGRRPRTGRSDTRQTLRFGARRHAPVGTQPSMGWVSPCSAQIRGRLSMSNSMP